MAARSASVIAVGLPAVGRVGESSGLVLGLPAYGRVPASEIPGFLPFVREYVRWGRLSVSFPGFRRCRPGMVTLGGTQWTYSRAMRLISGKTDAVVFPVAIPGGGVPVRCGCSPGLLTLVDSQRQHSRTTPLFSGIPDADWMPVTAICHRPTSCPSLVLPLGALTKRWVVADAGDLVFTVARRSHPAL